MTNRLKEIVRAVAAVLVLFGAGASAGSAAQAPKKVTVGLMFGMTGAASPIGPVQLEGAKLAIKEINADGGVKLHGTKLPLDFVVKDDESKPDIAIRRFREMLTENHADFILGQTFAPLSAAINKEVKKTPVAYFPVNVVAVTMFDKNEMAESTFAVHGCAYSIGYAGASYIADKLKLKKIVFFGPAYAFGRDQWDGAKVAFAKLYDRKTPITAADLLNDRVQAWAIGHAARKGAGRRPELAGKRGERRALEIQERKLRTTGVELPSPGSTDAASGAGDKHRLTLEIQSTAHHAPSSFAGSKMHGTPGGDVPGRR